MKNKKIKYSDEYKEKKRESLNKIKLKTEKKKKKGKGLKIDPEKIFKGSKVLKKQPMQKAAELLITELKKAKTAPIGSISADGRRKKVAEGKWIPVEKKNRVKRFLEKMIP